MPDSLFIVNVTFPTAPLVTAAVAVTSETVKLRSLELPKENLKVALLLSV